MIPMCPPRGVDMKEMPLRDYSIIHEQNEMNLSDFVHVAQGENLWHGASSCATEIGESNENWGHGKSICARKFVPRKSGNWRKKWSRM